MRIELDKNLLIDKNRNVLVTSDPDSFFTFVFDKEKEQKIATLIMSEFKVQKGSEIHLYGSILEKIDSQIGNGKSVSRTMVSNVWKMLLSLGMLKRRRKGGPVTLDDKFCLMMTAFSSRWNEYYNTWR